MDDLPTFEDVVAQTRERIEREARRNALLAMFDEGGTATEADIARALANRQPPTDEEVEQLAAAFIVAAAEHAEYVHAQAQLAVDGLQAKVDKLDELLAATRAASDGHERALQDSADHLDHWRGQREALPDHLAGVRPDGPTTFAQAGGVG